MPHDLPERVNLAEEFLTRRAREFPNRIAIQGEPRQATYGELGDAAARVAGALASAGCGRGERVLLILPDSFEFIAAFFGTILLGAVAVPVNSAARPADYAYYLADTGARVAIVHSKSLENFVSMAEAGVLELLVLVEGGASGRTGMRTETWEDWVGTAAPLAEPAPTKAEDIAFFLYTSGSGGTPKAAMHRHVDMLITSRCYANKVLGLGSGDRTFSVSKLFFAYGLGNGMYFPLGAGASTILLPDRPRPEAVAEIVARHRPTIFFAVPTFYGAFLAACGKGLAADFTSVRLAVSAGEPLPAEIFTAFRDRFGIEILDGIGSTEMLHIFVSPCSGRTRAGSCGFEVPGYEVRIVDEEGKLAPEGSIGNLWVRGESAFAGYWNKPELTARTKRGEWVVTGDKFFQDADGFYHYCGRADDMMKVSGMWVAPAEVENALLGHPAVAEAAIVGRSYNGLTRPVAYVILERGKEPGEELIEDLRSFLRARLPSYKVPSEFHFPATLPKTATGKIERYKLRQS